MSNNLFKEKENKMHKFLKQDFNKLKIISKGFNYPFTHITLSQL
jgi:hypothetical protein